ncbi:hypothetical protein SeMB42_g03007 [Synchytrium endobioticum]|uniref:Uncharacterized protein n=1 Tax=Synchytrium endobioticum TaxID=286115 RepID=A0A507DAJ7_9FUNG|nr:hypothetical protein SeMB42_g03003 [Synchytrium endobioticum]TPX48425.1 hypothetical protein SeMB42_g03007 [Synchytrium endobioticum]
MISSKKWTVSSSSKDTHETTTSPLLYARPRRVLPHKKGAVSLTLVPTQESSTGKINIGVKDYSKGKAKRAPPGRSSRTKAADDDSDGPETPGTSRP